MQQLDASRLVRRKRESEKSVVAYSLELIFAPTLGRTRVTFTGVDSRNTPHGKSAPRAETALVIDTSHGAVGARNCD